MATAIGCRGPPFRVNFHPGSPYPVTGGPAQSFKYHTAIGNTRIGYVMEISAPDRVAYQQIIFHAAVGLQQVNRFYRFFALRKQPH